MSAISNLFEYCRARAIDSILRKVELLERNACIWALPIMSKSWRTWAFSKKIATFAAKWVAYYDKEYSL